MLGTPSASPPPWLVAAHPDVLMVRADGRRMTYGHRREYCPTNATYRAYAARITQAMADHYHDHPQVIGWQIDNEFGDRCYCPACQQSFHAWLRDKYGSLDALNSRWGTVFWSHEYTDWAQIPLPWTTSNNPNPGLDLDYRRFMSDTYVGFQQAQIDLLRQTCPDQFITHNFMGFRYDLINYFDLAAPLDCVSWDNYPRGWWNMQGEDVDHAGIALAHTTMRGLKNQPFWVMEQQSGPAGWEMISPSPQPGEIRLWAYQAIAHGADAIVFFRWRTARFGTEEYWHGVLDHDGRPRRRYAEVQQMGQEIARIGDQIAGAEVRAEVALLLDYDTRFAFQLQPNNPAFRYPDHAAACYKALHRHNVPVDVVPPPGDLERYKLVIAPALYVLPDAVAGHLRRYVEGGGVLVLTARSGVKDPFNAVVDLPLPGLLADLCGVEVADYDSLVDGVTRGLAFEHAAFDGAGGAASIWCDVLASRGAEVAARYTSGYYAGQPAITVHRAGQGTVIYVGTFGDAALADSVTGAARRLAGVSPLRGVSDPAPGPVEVTARWQGDRRLLFVLNHSLAAQSITLDRPYTDLLTGARHTGSISLAGRGVLVLAEA